MTALILVDLQVDFMPGGALAVRDANQVLPVVNELLKKTFDIVIATKDWHPKHHGSFASTHRKHIGDQVLLDGIPQILWPDHCVQGSKGAEFHRGWDSSKVDKVITKGIYRNVDSYSTFFDNEKRRSTGLGEFLIQKGVQTVYLAGLATDYCVKFSALDAKRLGFETYVIIDGCRGVNLRPHDTADAIDEMKKAGVKIVTSAEVKGKH